MAGEKVEHGIHPSENREGLFSAIEFWNGIKADIRTAFETQFSFWIDDLKKLGCEQEEIDLRIEKAIHREKEFVTSFLEKFQKAISENPKGTAVLFDIDETIGTPHFITDEKVITFLRPSIVPLLEKITSFGAEVGFITSRSKEGVEKQLEDKEHLLSIKQYINPQFIYSSRGESVMPPSNFERWLKNDLDKEGGIIDFSLIKEEHEFFDLQMGGNIAKLALLKNIRKEIPEKAIVVIDDFHYPKYLNKKNKLYGVSLTDEGKFFNGL